MNTTFKYIRKISFFIFRYFYNGNVECNCDLMWLVYLMHDMPITAEGGCANNNKQLFQLVPQDFNCIGLYQIKHITLKKVRNLQLNGFKYFIIIITQCFTTFFRIRVTSVDRKRNAYIIEKKV